MPAFGYRTGNRCTDNNFLGLWLKNNVTHSYDGGSGNLHVSEHMFGYPFATETNPVDWTGEVGMVLAGSNIRTIGTYADTQRVGVRVTGPRNRISDMLWWAPVEWINTTDIIGVDIQASGCTVESSTFSIHATTMYRGYPVRVASGVRDTSILGCLKAGDRWTGFWQFLGNLHASILGNRADNGDDIPEYTDKYLWIARGSDGQMVWRHSGTNPFRWSAHGSGATGHVSLRMETAGAGMLVGAAGGRLGFNGTPPIARPSLTYSRATETAADAQLRTALAALGLVTDATTA